MKKIKLAIFGLLACCSFHSILAQNWDAVEIGQCPTTNPFDLTLADGRNDGMDRLYVTSTKGGLYEWSFENNQWSLTGTLVEDFIALPSIAAGDGRNDGINRIYIVEFKNAGARLREFSYNNGQWSESIIENQIMSLGIILGDGRNDGVNRLYVTSIDFGLVEYSFENGSWKRTSVVSGEMEGAPDIGDAKNDGDQSVFSPAKHVWDSDYENGSFDNNNLDVDKTWPDALQIAPGRNDGINRVYANCTGDGGKGRKEYTWNGSSWDIEYVETAAQRGDIHVARLKKDGKYRVYINTSQYFRGPTGPLDEYEWDGSQWVKSETVMPAGTYATAMMATGAGRNDKVMRMYTPKWTTGGIYEITHSDPYVIGTTSVDDNYLNKNDFVISPQPTLDGQIRIQINPEIVDQVERFELWDLMGRKQASYQVEVAEWTTSIGSESGFYFIHFISKDGDILVKKLLRI